MFDRFSGQNSLSGNGHGVRGEFSGRRKSDFSQRRDTETYEMNFEPGCRNPGAGSFSKDNDRGGVFSSGQRFGKGSVKPY